MARSISPTSEGTAASTVASGSNPTKTGTADKASAPTSSPSQTTTRAASGGAATPAATESTSPSGADAASSAGAATPEQATSLPSGPLTKLTLIRVGRGQDMIKVSTRLGLLPEEAKRVRVKVLSTTPDDTSDDASITNVRIKPAGGNGHPVVTGDYAARGDGLVTGFRLVCFDSAGRALVARGTTTDKGAKRGSFSVTLDEAPTSWTPTSCYVGQSGSTF